ERYAALDKASSKLFERLRRARDRAKDHHRKNTKPVDLPAPPPPAETETPAAEAAEEQSAVPTTPTEPGQAVETQLGDSPVVVRQKLHDSEPMTVDQALYEMELVGHPFYLFIDAETNQPCVVYHRHGWTYGILRLNHVIAT